MHHPASHPWHRQILLSLALLLAVTAPPRIARGQASPFAVTNAAAFFELLDLAQPGLAALRPAVAAHDWPAAEQAWARHLAGRTSPRWLWSPSQQPQFLAVYNARFGGLARYTNAANLVVARQFDFLGVSKQLACHPQWLQGPIEWTHVLSRFGYWHDEGLAYWSARNPVYARDFVTLMEDWIQANPVPARVSNDRGPQGTVWRTLETGIRGQNWFDAMELFMNAPEFNARAKYLMTRSLVEQARYLDNYSTRFRHGNWQVCEAAGLATIGIMLPEFKESSGWRRHGLALLTRHLREDVLPDGAHWEVTPGYHAWVMNEFLKIALLARANQLALPDWGSRHEKMFDFLEAISRPDRTYPPVGDAGLGNRSIADAMGQGALMYGRGDFRYLAGNTCQEDWLWLFGPDACRDFERLPAHPPAFDSIRLPDAGYVMMRTGWQPADKYLLFDCAPWHPGHSHADRLQVTLFDGRDLLLDPGQCSYDQPESIGLRQSAAHNVVLLDDGGQLRGDPQLLAWQSNGQADFASGRITADGLSQQRSVLFVKPSYWVVMDQLSGPGNHQVTRLFHFPPGPARATAHTARTDFAQGPNVWVLPADDARLEMRSGLVPTGLATFQTAPVVALVSHGSLPLTLCTVLVPCAPGDQPPRLTTLSSTNSSVCRLRLVFANGQQDDLALAGRPMPLTIGRHHAVTQALCVRHGPDSQTAFAIPTGRPRAASPPP